MNLPTDPVMLLSFLNLKLRDYYPSLAALCEDLGLDEKTVCERLDQIDYHYDPAYNRFI